MSYHLIPGVRQDHRGRFYRIAVYPSGKTIAVPYEPSEQWRAFSFRFLSSEMGHRWYFAPSGTSVDSCGKPSCSICGEKRRSGYAVNEQEETA